MASSLIPTEWYIGKKLSMIVFIISQMKKKTTFSDIFLPFTCIVYAIDRDCGTNLYTQEKRAKLLIIQSSK